MYKSQNHWNEDFGHQDSGSESTVLLSSGSHTSVGPDLFPDSEVCDSDTNTVNASSRYGSTTATRYNSTNTVLPKRLPPLIQHSSLCISPPTNIQEKCYEIHNTDLLLENGKHEAENMQSITKEYTASFLPGTVPLEEVAQTPSKDVKPKQSSLVTVFSIWNTILGSSLLTMPWGIAMAGFFPGTILMLAMSGLCLYTAYRLLLVHEYYGGTEKIEVIQLSRIFLNKWAEYIAKIFSIAVLLGATIAYWVLMSNFLYNSVNFIYDNIIGFPNYSIINNETDTSEVLCLKKDLQNSSSVVTLNDKSFYVLGPVWDLYNTVPVFLALLIFPLLNFNSTTFFTKFNSLGTISIIYLIVFVMIKSVSWGINMDKASWEDSWILQSTFPALSGMLALSFFIHNIIITIMQSNHDQSKNGRDLTIAYILVTITYIVVGTVFFICFPLPKSCIEDNFLNNFQKWDGLTVGVRIVLLFQLLTVYPLLAYMLRVQLLSSICKTTPTRTLVFIINIILVTVCILFAVFLPHIGTVIRYTGAISGLIYVFTLPSLLHIAVLNKQRKLTLRALFFNLIIPIIGGSNLIAQFIISDH